MAVIAAGCGLADHLKTAEFAAGAPGWPNELRVVVKGDDYSFACLLFSDSTACTHAQQPPPVTTLLPCSLSTSPSATSSTLSARSLAFRVDPRIALSDLTHDQIIQNDVASASTLIHPCTSQSTATNHSIFNADDGRNGVDVR